MTTRAVAWLIAAVTILTSQALAEPAELTITYVSRANDETYVHKRRYTGLSLRDRFPVHGAVKAAMKESRVVGRALGFRLELLELQLGDDDAAIDIVRDHIAASNSRILILDVPLADLTELSGQLAGENLIVFNPRHRANRLRRKDCQPVLFHTVPSEAMAMDSLAQLLRKRNWVRVLMLVGEHDQDKVTAGAFAASAKKFGLTIVDRRTFTLRNDPRQRDKNNIALLTSGDYDAVFISDETGDFGRYVPFQTALPRPVVGAHGLRASAWHWTWERHGAPQLNQRFARKAKRQMSETDWAGWAAVKSVVEAVSRTKRTDVAAIAEFLASSQFVLDGYKGTPGSFRTWNNQLRQPILLHTHDAVIERAPLDGFLHQASTLDTLGDDAPASRCRFAVR